MRDIKPKIINRYEVPKLADKSKPQKKYPNVRIELSALPEAKDWELNKEYEVTLRLRMTGLNIRKVMKNNNGLECCDDYGNDATFDITGVDAPKKTSKDSGIDEDDDDTTEE